MIPREITTMRRLLPLVILFVGFVSVAPVMAQGICSQPNNSNTLYCTPILAIDNHLTVGSAAAIALQPEPGFLSLEEGVGTQLSEVPTPSPASGLIFSFTSSGLTQQQELGPIFSETPATVGKHRFSVALTYQFLQFDQDNGISLKQIPSQFGLCVSETGCGNFIDTQTRLDLKAHQITAYATFGLFSRVDVSVAIPILDVRMGVRTTCNPCSQQQPAGPAAVFTPSATAASAAGIGDVTFRAKANVLRKERAGFAVGIDIRTPTGDAANFLGSGTIGVRPFAAFSYRARISPHANIGYQANGNTILASQDLTTHRQLPNSLDYAVGVDARILKSLGVTGDLLGQTFFDAYRLYTGNRTQPNGQSGPLDTACDPTGTLPCQTTNFNTKSFALGAKYNPIGNLLITGNVLFKLDDNGLHFKPAPMIGLSYTF
jgi:hypothetical protein